MVKEHCNHVKVAKSKELFNTKGRENDEKKKNEKQKHVNICL